MNLRLYRHIRTLALTAAAALLAAAAHAAAPYVDNGDNTVTDTITGLQWDTCAEPQTYGCAVLGNGQGYSWDNAQAVVASRNSANYKGHSDWRLPSIAELESLLKPGSAPMIDSAAFPNTLGNYFWQFYWSSTNSANFSNSAWAFSFFDGTSQDTFKSASEYVTLVRGGQWQGIFGLVQTGVTSNLPTSTSATLTTTSPVKATGYWVVVAHNATAPSVAQLVAGTDYSGVTVLAHGSGAMNAKVATNFVATGLAVGAAYDFYAVAQDNTSVYNGYSDITGPLAFTQVDVATITDIVIAIDPVTPTTLYAGVQGDGVYKRMNGGAWIKSSLADARVKALFIDAGNSLYAGTDGGGIFKSADGGNTWSACGNPGNLKVHSLAGSGGTLYAGTMGGVAVSTNGCASWSPLNSGLPF